MYTHPAHTHACTRRSLRLAIWKIAPKNHTCSFSIFLFSFCNGFFLFIQRLVRCVLFFFTINVDRCLLDCLLVLFWSSIYVTNKRIFTDFFGLYLIFLPANEIYNRSLNGVWQFVLSSFVEKKKVQNGFGRMSRFSPRNKNCIYFAVVHPKRAKNAE